MILYRLAQSQYAKVLRSSGAPNRWNKAEQHVIYTGQSISFCALELLAHTNGVRPSGSYKIMIIEMDAAARVKSIALERLPDNWNSLSKYGYTQTLGSNWYENRESLVLKVPSAIVPDEHNFVLNTEHPDFGNKVRIVEIQGFFLG